MTTIRPAVPSDASALSCCIDAAYEEYHERIGDLPPVSDGIDDDILRNQVWVAENDGQVVGGIVLVLREGYAVLANLAVDPNSSGKGLGRKLIDCAEHHCRENGVTELRLTTHAKMPDNISLYSHLGWVVSDRAGGKVHMTKGL